LQATSGHRLLLEVHDECSVMSLLGCYVPQPQACEGSVMTSSLSFYLFLDGCVAWIYLLNKQSIWTPWFCACFVDHISIFLFF
jgi:hypothetical protein